MVKEISKCILEGKGSRQRACNSKCKYPEVGIRRISLTERKSVMIAEQ